MVEDLTAGRDGNRFVIEIADMFGGKVPSPKEATALQLAFIGDAVYELIIRTAVLTTHAGRSGEMSRRAIAFERAASQSEMVEAIMPLLTEEEAGIYRRGRNANPSSTAKNASIADYRRATGLEALIGY